MQKPTLKEQLEEADARAQEALALLKDPSVTRDRFEELVRRYTLCKFFLEPGECGSDDIFTLAEASIEKLLRMNDQSVRLAQGSTTCTNQSSTDIKKVLLSMTLQRALGCKLTPDESADVLTVGELADALYDRLADTRAAACA